MIYRAKAQACSSRLLHMCKYSSAVDVAQHSSACLLSCEAVVTAKRGELCFVASILDVNSAESN